MATIVSAVAPGPARVAQMPVSRPAGRSNSAGEAVVLRDGTAVTVRPIRPSDAAALRRFHRRLSERTVYQRFFAPHPELSEEQAYSFTHLDGRRRVALVAVDPERPGEIVAVVRFDLDPDGTGAEYAAVVADGWQGRGLGWAMTQLLIAEARSRGVRRLYAFVLPDNTRMRDLLLRLGIPARRSFEDGFDRIDLDLATAPAVSMAGSPAATVAAPRGTAGPVRPSRSGGRRRRSSSGG